MNGVVRHVRVQTRAARRLVVLVATATLASAALLATPAASVAEGAAEGAAERQARAMSEPFRISTFNILGASHTVRSKKFDTYKPRMRRTLRLIDQKGFSIVGLQEFQKVQYDMFVRRTAGAWGVYPGLEEGVRPVQNSIVWRQDTWKRIEAHTYVIPYFHGNLVEQPYIRLRNRASGAEVWVINTHNPASTKGDASGYRATALANQAALVNDLKATGVPSVLLGDFNDREKAFCYLTGRAPLKATNGGSWRDGTCVPPRPSIIDWIFISKSAQSTGYTALDNAFVDSITDHRVIYADVSVPMS